MSENLTSVGIDVGTTSTQMVVSRLRVENRASGFSVPEMEITRREILYKSPVHFTPLLSGKLVDGAALRRLLEEEYRSAGITRQDVDTGAVIITGETSRKENAKTVLEALAGFAGDFVVAAAGPELESLLAAKGAGAPEYSRRTGERVLHMDIGGGTSNLALVEAGEIVKSACLNVGGRLLKMDESGRVTDISPEIRGLTPLREGDAPRREQVRSLCDSLVKALEMAAGLREPDGLLDALWTKELGRPAAPVTKEPVTLSFSGGVADCIDKEHDFLAFGDIGPELGRAIRESRLCKGTYRLGEQTIRATVIGAGCHSAQLSGSTVFCRNVALPLKNLPVTCLDSPREEPSVIALPHIRDCGYETLRDLAKDILARAGEAPLYLCMERDMAKALGQMLALNTAPDRSILCIDRVKLSPGSYLDVGQPIGPALPVVVKTLVLQSQAADS